MRTTPCSRSSTSSACQCRDASRGRCRSGRRDRDWRRSRRSSHEPGLHQRNDRAHAQPAGSAHGHGERHRDIVLEHASVRSCAPSRSRAPCRRGTPARSARRRLLAGDGLWTDPRTGEKRLGLLVVGHVGSRRGRDERCGTIAEGPPFAQPACTAGSRHLVAAGGADAATMPVPPHVDAPGRTRTCRRTWICSVSTPSARWQWTPSRPRLGTPRNPDGAGAGRSRSGRRRLLFRSG